MMTGEAIARFNKTAAFGSRQDTGYERATMNPEKTRSRDGRSRLLQREKAADLTDQGQSMSTSRLGLSVLTSDERSDDSQGDHWIIDRKSTFQKPVEHPESAPLIAVLITGGALAFEKPFKLRRERRAKDGLR
jgi:hypothetical protein